MNKIELIRKISQYLGYVTNNKNIILPKVNRKYIPIVHHKKDEVNLYLNESSDKIQIISYNESHHNGSSFSEDDEEIEFSEELQDEVLRILKKEYLDKEFKRLEKEAEDMRIENLKKKIISPEKRFSEHSPPKHGFVSHKR
jgi:hypothetical protein